MSDCPSIKYPMKNSISWQEGLLTSVITLSYLHSRLFAARRGCIYRNLPKMLRLGKQWIYNSCTYWLG
ncbi:hypothetical protein BDV23DRAFT_162867 [Aspergillus alliaceus]|uniref:Uncharacterized protein n=1 Tax=Petromyces alliaceus TaxID=209559 RepID=A0A5N7BXP6_PETAA|nr:hypothetical protein BDV23DRAFT_162867 [Aspergillus alliaceus]